MLQAGRGRYEYVFVKAFVLAPRPKIDVGMMTPG